MASSLRLFVSTSLAAGGHVDLREEQAHYLRTVMRRNTGDPVLLFNGRDGEWRGAIAELQRGRARIDLSCQTRVQGAEPGPWLVFAPLKRDATDLVIRMATELGVEAVQPVLTERTMSTRVNLDRLRLIAIEAAEQSERLTVPDIRSPCALATLLTAWPIDRCLYVAIERSTAGEAPVARRDTSLSGLLIGPEGGFSPVERDALAGSSVVVPISLGGLVLRAETACIAGLAWLRSGGFRPSLLQAPTTG